MSAPGDHVDRYVLEVLLGAGGMGEVFEATDTRLHRRVALKLLRPGADASFIQRMVREARAAAALEHPNAVVVYDVGEWEGGAYLAMELIRGRTMRTFVGDGDVPMSRRIRWLADVARALAAAHDAGLVHRDVKPDNVMIRDDGVVKVLDFGIARRRAPVDPSAPTRDEAAAETVTADGVVVGTPLYLAPEQLRCETLDGRADQFGWGITAYELLSGSPPWRADSGAVAVLASTLSSPVPPLSERAPSVPGEVERAVHRALEKLPADRHPSMVVVADALEPHAEQSSGAQRTPGSIPAPSHGSGSRLAPRILGWAAAAGVGALLVYLATGRAGPEPAGVGPEAMPISALACKDAVVRSDAGASELARAIGIGACARLAIDIGVEWAVAGADQTLDVEAMLAPGEAKVTLRVSDREGRSVESSAIGPTPIAAIVGAIEVMRPRVSPPPVSEREIAEWGARTADGTRRLRRAFRRFELDLVADPRSEISALLETEPDSPWSYVLSTFVTQSGSAVDADARAKALERVDRLPPTKAKATRAFLMTLAGAKREDVLPMMRSAYLEAGDDAEVATFYAAVLLWHGLRDEGLSVVDRIHQKSPTRSLTAMRFVFWDLPDRNPERDRKYIERMQSVFPEARAWPDPLRAVIADGRLDEARAALDFGRDLGLAGPGSDPTPALYTRAQIELASFRPKAAREAAAALLSEPRPTCAALGAAVTIASYLLEGRLVDARHAREAEIERQRALGSPSQAAGQAADDLRLRRWLGEKPPAAERLEWMEKVTENLPASLIAAIRSEVALARMRAAPADAKRLAKEALAALDGKADEWGADPVQRDGWRVGSLALVRAARGDEAAVARWRDTARASFPARRLVALDAALALEAVGDAKTAEEAYRLAADPGDLDWTAFAAAAAHLRLSALLRTAGRAEEAASLEKRILDVWSGADTGLAEAVRAMR